MSISIKLDVEDDCVKENVSCHRLPCKINFNGYSKVSKYFTPYIREDDSENTFTCSLRGYPLQGQEVKVPEGYSGVVLRERKHVDSDEIDLKATAVFKKYLSWNWDRMPLDDEIPKAFQWIDIASVLHEPVTEGDSTKSPQKQKKRKLPE